MSGDAGSSGEAMPVEAMQRAATEYLVRRYSGPGNPMKAEILRRGSVTATKVPYVPDNAIMNSVHGLSDEADLPAVLEFYAASDQPCWIGLCPRTASAALTSALIEAGFGPESHSAVLGARVSQPSAPAAANVEVERVTRDTLATFLETLARGHDSPEAIIPSLVKNQSFWIDEPAFVLLLARVQGDPAGAAVLHREGHIAYLATAATLPAFRGLRVHSSLIRARRQLALELGCAFVTGQARFDSTSHRNQLRAGLSLVTVRQTWAPRR